MKNTSFIYSVFLGITFWESSQAATLDKDFWFREGENDVEATLEAEKKLNWNVAKNIILVIGDGMGVTTTTAARVYKGEKDPDLMDAEAKLSWDEFEHTGYSKTYSTDYIVTDSAASATAYHCGVKAKSGTLGLDDTLTKRAVCDNVESAKVKSVLDWALTEGKSVGIVTTDSVAGASPSALYAHSPDRNWQHTVPVAEAAKGCTDIVSQLVDSNININVVLSGGRASFINTTTRDPEHPDKYGSRTDGRNLIEEWETEQKKRSRKLKYVMNKQQFDGVDPEQTDYLLGLFEPARMQEETDRKINQTEPSLAEMVEKALKILKRNKKGYYLFVEGANIDIGHHENRARKALEETLALDEAVKVLKEQTNHDDTLIVVSADHSHAFSFSGYSTRGNSVLGLSKLNTTLQKDLKGNHYPLLTYGNGPGGSKNKTDLTEEEFDQDTIYPAIFPLAYDNHGGEDVALYATGPMSHLFSGTHEQSYIAHSFAYAGCLNGRTKHCETTISSTIIHSPQTLLMMLAITFVTLLN